MSTKLSILSGEGQKWETEVDPTVTIAELKQKAFEKLYHPGTIDVDWDSFRVVFANEFRTLADNHSVHEERLKDQDILILVRRRSLVEENVGVEMELKAPTMEEIKAATAHLGVMELPKPTASPSQASSNFDNWTESDFQLELRKIIISMISVMSTLLRKNSDAEAICGDMQTKIRNRLASCSGRKIEGTSFVHPDPPEVSATPIGLVAGIIELKKREFRPNQAAMETLRGMGYSDGEIIDALRFSKNNRVHAAQWLSFTDRTIPEDIVQGLEANSRLLNSLVTNPVIRYGLNNPKLLQAFLGIIESSSTANLWLSDPDTGPILSSIFKLYHADKHMTN